MKKILGFLAILMLVGGAGCTNNTDDSVPNVTVPPQNIPTDTNTPPVTSIPSETTNPTASSTSNGTKTYSLKDVQAANTPEKCWTAIRGEVYDLTAWISKHPGGDRAILKLCGIDGTSLYVNKHGGQAQPEKVLAGFELGKLQ